MWTTPLSLIKKRLTQSKMERRQRPEAPASSGDAPSDAAAGATALPWGMAKKEMQPSSLTSLTDDKLARFVIGQQKKTKFEKVCTLPSLSHDLQDTLTIRYLSVSAMSFVLLLLLFRIAKSVRLASARRTKKPRRSTPSSSRRSRTRTRRWERRLSAARCALCDMLLDGVLSSGRTDIDWWLAYVVSRTQTAVQGSAQQQQPGHHQRGELYRLKPKDDVTFNNSSSLASGITTAFSAAPAALRPGKKLSEMDRMLEEMKQKDAERQVRREQHQTASVPGGGPTKKRREIDQFLEELKERYRTFPILTRWTGARPDLWLMLFVNRYELVLFVESPWRRVWMRWGSAKARSTMATRRPRTSTWAT